MLVGCLRPRPGEIDVRRVERVLEHEVVELVRRHPKGTVGALLFRAGVEVTGDHQWQRAWELGDGQADLCEAQGAIGEVDVRGKVDANDHDLWKHEEDDPMLDDNLESLEERGSRLAEQGADPPLTGVVCGRLVPLET